MSTLVRTALHPVAEVDRQDTSLRYTDLLFGFVVRELFIRLQNWPQLPAAARLQLVSVTVLVLGSWIGYRRSLNRSTYAVKFFNLPFWRFVIDQLMLVIYFRLAVLTEYPWTGKQDLSTLASHTATLVVDVFGLYLLWDALGIRIAAAADGEAGGKRRPRYPAIDRETNEKTESWSPIDWAGVIITASALIAVALVRAGGDRAWVLPALIVILLGYRWIKEIRTSWQETPHA
ncbi:MAG TPA: hypothetical protein VH740_22815 [Vicinamibacterales bacterium]|jgi:hypothetical protein